MTKIFMNFAGMDDLKRQMGNLVDQLHELEREIARVNGRLDWEVSQKHDIDEQIDRARRKAAKLAVTSEQMTAVVATASTEFMRTDAKFSEKAKEQTNTLENIWRGFLGFATRTFDQIEGEGMQLLNSLRLASDIFMGRITDVLSVHPDLIRDMLGCCAVGVTPLAPFVVDEKLRNRINAVNRGIHGIGNPLTKLGTSIGNQLNDINEKYIGGPLNKAAKEYNPKIEARRFYTETDLKSTLYGVKEGYVGGSASKVTTPEISGEAEIGMGKVTVTSANSEIEIKTVGASGTASLSLSKKPEVSLYGKAYLATMSTKTPMRFSIGTFKIGLDFDCGSVGGGLIIKPNERIRFGGHAGVGVDVTLDWSK